VGRAYRHEGDMTPVVKATVRTQEPGNPPKIGAPVQRDRDLIGKTGNLTVNVRSGNADPSGIGINKSAWGIMGLGDAAPAAAQVPVKSNAHMYLILGGIAAVGALFFLRKRKS
jgi:LPXTG-motif cell wall-anchored protein